MFGLLGILKDPMGNLKSIAFIAIFVSVVTYCGVLWVKNDNLVADASLNAVTMSNYKTANDAFAKQLTDERAETKRVNDLLREAQETAKNVQPIFTERTIYVDRYRKDTSIVKCNLAPQWVSGHNASATNPERALEDRGSTQPGSGTTGPNNTSEAVDDGAALSVITENYEKYYKLKTNYMTLLKVCKGESVTDSKVVE